MHIWHLIWHIGPISHSHSLLSMLVFFLRGVLSLSDGLCVSVHKCVDVIEGDRLAWSRMYDRCPAAFVLTSDCLLCYLWPQVEETWLQFELSKAQRLCLPDLSLSRFNRLFPVLLSASRFLCPWWYRGEIPQAYPVSRSAGQWPELVYEVSWQQETVVKPFIILLRVNNIWF